MNRQILTIALAVWLTGTFGTAYANSDVTSTTSQETDSVIVAVVEGEETDERQEQTTLNVKKIEETAGILPSSFFYDIERAIERLQIEITKSEERLSALKAQFATERAAEAVVMTNEGEEELASEATAEYLEMLTSAAEHINNAIEEKDEAVQTLENLNESHKTSKKILETILEMAPEDTREAIEDVLNEQDKTIAAVNGFYAAKQAFFEAKEQFQEAKSELEAVKHSGDEEAIRTAEEKVKEAEALKNELEALKDDADVAKEEVKHLAEEAEKRVEIGFKHIEKANKKMENIEENILEVDEKEKEEAKKKEKKAREEAKETKEKAREEAKKAIEKAKEEAKKVREKAREEAKQAKEKAKR